MRAPPSRKGPPFAIGRYETIVCLFPVRSARSAILRPRCPPYRETPLITPLPPLAEGGNRFLAIKANSMRGGMRTTAQL